jgi:hypothetical protein
MTLLSPFNVRSPVFFVEFAQAGHKIKNFRIRRVAAGMIFFSCLNYNIDNIWKTATAAAPLFHSVINFCRHDELPTVIIEHLVDDGANFVIGYVIATADEHFDSLCSITACFRS